MQKTNFKTRLLALLTAVFMVVMCVPFAAFADDAVMTINFYVDSQPVGSDSFKQEYGTWTLRDALEDDSVIPEGKELTGWVPLGHSEVTLKPGTSYSWDELSQYAQGGTLTLEAVFEAPKPATKPVYVSYILESGEPLANATEQIEMENGATTFSTSLLKKVPAGYELCETGDVYIGTNDTVNVKVREIKKPAKVVYVSYILESGEPLANATEQIELENGATTFSTSLLKKVPAGYELCETGDVYIGTNDTVNVKVREVKKPEASLTKIKMIFTKADGATSVFATGELTAASEWYVLPDAAGVINLTASEKLTGWTLFQNGAKYAAGEKVTFESLKELAGKNVDKDGVAYLNFYADLKTDVELKNITIKYVEDKDGAQEDVAAPQNNFTAKDEFTILTDNLYDGKVPAGKKLIGWQYKNGGNTTNFVKGEHVKFDTLKALLNGNWDNEGNAWVTLTPVFQDVKSENGNSSSGSSSNSSSSASSSSNTTNTSASNTTNTSASQKQVVKAAAAPANTTKVLPKTGATNAAPLIGGSLAVVALLMGYGVYGLVLRKKD